MALVIRTVLATLAVGAVTSAIAACHDAGCRDGDTACAALTDPTTTTDASSSTTDATTTGTSTEPTTTATTGTTEPPAPVCGNGIVEDGEACDDGDDDDLDACRTDCTMTFCGDGVVQPATEQCDDGNDDDSDSCVAGCVPATCGDGFTRAGVEACDAGADNDDTAYGGCTTACVPGPRCGDAVVNGPEECDDKNTDEADGCMTSCLEARSCLQIKRALPAATTGPYRLWPAALAGESSVMAWCDMDSDGGGYTFLKVDTEFGVESDKGAKKAEMICQQHGMHLLVTRTPEHAVSAYNVATTVNLSPVGGGLVTSGPDYIAILGIYPTAQGATCEGGALNSDDCPGWTAGDGQPYWVTSTPVADQPDMDHCLGCSMFYKWNPDGTIKSYVTVSFGEGASSYRFLCDVGDKHP